MPLDTIEMHNNFCLLYILVIYGKNICANFFVFELIKVLYLEKFKKCEKPVGMTSADHALVYLCL